jgi:hypothetical protein
MLWLRRRLRKLKQRVPQAKLLPLAPPSWFEPAILAS